MAPPDQTQSQTQIPPKKKRGCFFYGCLTSLVLLLLAGIAIFIGVRYTMSLANGMITQYTATSPVALEKTEMSADELKKLNERVTAFTAAMDGHSNTPPLVLTGPELNAWLTASGNKQFKDTFFITLQGEEIKANLSVPLDLLSNVPFVNAFHIKGRYFNGNGTFKASIENGQLFVFPQSLNVKGEPLPENVMVSFRHQNIAQGFNQNANPSPFEKFQSIVVTNSTVVITPKP